MFPNLIQLITGRPAAEDFDAPFIQEVRLTRTKQRNRRSERYLLGCWVLIALKCSALQWLAWHYAMPFNMGWVIWPTICAGLVTTWIYWSRN